MNGMGASTKVTVPQVIRTCLLLDGLIETDDISFPWCVQQPTQYNLLSSNVLSKVLD